jgi:YD repeat-containing protein
MNACKPVCTYDANGKLIHYKNSSGFECWREYDSNGKEIYYKDNRGFDCWYGYDSNGNHIHSKASDGFEVWYWEGEETEDPVKILLLASQLHSKVS